MARASRKPDPEAPLDPTPQPSNVHELSPVLRYIKRIRTSRQALVDSRMQHASIYKEAEEDNLHTRALKDTIKLTGQDVVKSQAYMKALVEYLIEARFLASDTVLSFTQADIEDQQPAA